MTDDTAVPVLYEHCCTVYDGMMAQAEKRQHRGDSEGEFIVYEGFLTQLFHDLHLSVPYYTKVMTALKNMGCVRQLRRGGSSSPSQWELCYSPTVEAFTRQQEPKRPKQTTQAETRQLIRDLNKRVALLEGQLESTIEFLSEKFGTEEAG
jgi:hypothetical protein